jgi:alkanesulfonate monooxygenase SsuD/methylene tetrahydromethanopterin reductase-like flavin-dependent oxidoreductase (luciferase family)
MRHGILFIGKGTSIADMVAVSQDAERLGWHSVNMVEAYRSGPAPMAALALGTTTIQVGSYILNAYGRSPYLTAITALDLDEISGGRIRLGVGSGNRDLNANYLGVGKDRPLRKLREYVEIINQVVSAPAGATVRYSGEIHSLRWTAANNPTRPTIPVHLAAIFPGMVKVAARVADGIGLGVMLSPEYVRDVVRPTAAAAAADADRDPTELAFPMAIVTAVDEDERYARNLIRQAICGFFHPTPHSYYEFLLREQGYSRVADACLRYVPDGKPEKAMETMDDELIDRLALAGTPETCAKRVADYEGVVDEMIHLNVSTPREADPAAGAKAAFEGLLTIPTSSPS